MQSVPEVFGIQEAQLTEMVVKNDLRSAKAPEDRILAELERHGYSSDTIFAIKLALEEAMTNAVKHGNGNDPARHITVRYYVDDQHAVVMVRDEGHGFMPSAVPDPTQSENLERPFGRGLMLMQCYMTRIEFNERGNEVWMQKKRNEGSP